MFNNAKLMATSDLQVAINTKNQAPDKVKILYVGDLMDRPAGVDCINATNLCPDYTTLEIYIEFGDKDNAFMNAYVSYLNASPAAGEVFATILYALSTGINVVMYMPPETLELRYPSYLLQYIESVYGLTAATNSTQYAYNPAFKDNNVRTMYMFNLVPPLFFIQNCETMDDMVLAKVKRDYLQKYPEIASYSSQQMYQFVENVAKNGEPLTSGIILPDASRAFGNI